MNAFAAFSEGLCPWCLEPMNPAQYCAMCTIRWAQTSSHGTPVIKPDRSVPAWRARAAAARRAASAGH